MLDTSSTSDLRFGSNPEWVCDHFLPGLVNRNFSSLVKQAFYIFGHCSIPGPVGRGGPRISDSREIQDYKEVHSGPLSASPSLAYMVRGQPGQTAK